MSWGHEWLQRICTRHIESREISIVDYSLFHLKVLVLHTRLIFLECVSMWLAFDRKPTLIRWTAFDRSSGVRNHALVGESGNKNLTPGSDTTNIKGYQLTSKIRPGPSL